MIQPKKTPNHHHHRQKFTNQQKLPKKKNPTNHCCRSDPNTQRTFGIAEEVKCNADLRRRERAEKRGVDKEGDEEREKRGLSI